MSATDDDSERRSSSPPPLTVVDLGQQAAAVAEGTPSRLMARLNESGVRLSVYRGEGNWHAHTDTDECFVVLEGALSIDIFEGPAIDVGPGQLVTIPAGTVHRPRSVQRTVLLCFKRLKGHTDYFELVAPGDTATASIARLSRGNPR